MPILRRLFEVMERKEADKMKKKTMALILIALFALTFASGCVSQQNPVKSAEDVQERVTGISGSIENVQSTLQDIDTSIG